MKTTPLQYEIRIQGHLAPHRLRHFEGIIVRQEAGGETVIEGNFRDQAALYGLLHWLQRLGVALLLVRRMEGPSETDVPTGEATCEKATQDIGNSGHTLKSELALQATLGYNHRGRPRSRVSYLTGFWPAEA